MNNYKRIDVWQNQSHLLTLVGYTRVGVYLKIGRGDPEPISKEKFDKLVDAWRRKWQEDKRIVLKGNLIPRDQRELINKEREKFDELLTSGRVVL